MTANDLGESSAQKARFYFLLEVLRKQGFAVKQVDYQPRRAQWDGARLLLGLGSKTFAAVIRTGDGRADRLLPQMALAILEARAYAQLAGKSVKPMAIALVDQVSQLLVRAVDDMVGKLAPRFPVAIVDHTGRWSISVPGLTSRDFLNASKLHKAEPSSTQSVNLFSDANQWMLKMLLAWHLPEGLIAAPKIQYRSGRQLADAAGVSHVSANRFLSQLKESGFLDRSSDFIRLVQREKLLLRWRGAVSNSKKEIPARFLFPSNAESQMRKLMKRNFGQACLGLFAAADKLQVGHVNGVVPYVYVPKLAQISMVEDNWKGLIPCKRGEAANLYIRQASFPISVFKGAVERDGEMCTDVLQVWLDVSYHPARGQEQADLIYRHYLRPIVEG